MKGYFALFVAVVAIFCSVWFLVHPRKFIVFAVFTHTTSKSFKSLTRITKSHIAARP